MKLHFKDIEACHQFILQTILHQIKIKFADCPTIGFNYTQVIHEDKSITLKIVSPLQPSIEK